MCEQFLKENYLSSDHKIYLLSIILTRIGDKQVAYGTLSAFEHYNWLCLEMFELCLGILSSSAVRKLCSYRMYFSLSVYECSLLDKFWCFAEIREALIN